MRRVTAHIVITLAFVLSLVSCGKKTCVIPKEKMAEIYAEMYVMDQWLDDNRSLRREADTSLVYAPVLEKYGYTYDDYLNSVSAYMKDPTRYSRILRRTSEILNGRLSELKAEKKTREEALKESRRLDSLRNLVHLNVDSLMKVMSRTNPSDSVTVAWDSLGFVDFRFVQTNDTTYDGPAMVLRIDSAAIAASDSLVVVADSLSVVTDSLRPETSEPVKVELAPELKLHDGQPAAGNARMRRLLPARDTVIKLQ